VAHVMGSFVCLIRVNLVGRKPRRISHLLVGQVSDEIPPSFVWAWVS
jgi:hypothetical protein